MNTFELIAPCHFGLESILKKEIYDLGYEISMVEDGRVTFIGDAEAICRANIFLRTAERVLVKVGSFRAVSFEELYTKTRALNWGRWIPQDGKCWVAKASSIRSQLFSTSDIQSVMKKALVDKMKIEYDTDVIPETGANYPLRVFIKKDIVTVGLDTTGNSLHKRGYRTSTAKAPISETLAAALILLTHWKPEQPFVDPFCGSGTFPIEAAMIAANIAPGMNRPFLAETWTNLIPRKLWYESVNEANDLIEDQIEVDIQGYDADGTVIKKARDNARRAGVDHMIHFQQRPVQELSHSKKGGCIVTNPPYGERLKEEDLFGLYQKLGERFQTLEDWSAYVITPFESIEKAMGRKADKNRKIYNGMLKTYFYQFLAPQSEKEVMEKE